MRIGHPQTGSIVWLLLLGFALLCVAWTISPWLGIASTVGVVIGVLVLSRRTSTPPVHANEPTLAEILAKKATLTPPIAPTARRAAASAAPDAFGVPAPALRAAEDARVVSLKADLAVRVVALKDERVTRTPPQIVPTTNTVVPLTASPTPVRASPRQQWIPPGQLVVVANMQISGGGFYLRNSAPSVKAFHAAVVDGLAVDTTRTPDWAGHTIDYWPRYIDLTPQQRAAFLAYLNSNRRNTHVGASYMWLYVYGLEERALSDPLASIPEAERTWLLDELMGLQALHADAPSVRRYLPSLIATASARLREAKTLIATPSRPWARDWTDAVRLQLGLHVANAQALSADWAFQWALLEHPKACGHIWECVLDELHMLFVDRFRVQYPAGLQIAPGKRLLRLSHEFASRRGEVFQIETPAIAVDNLTRGIAPAVQLIDHLMATLEPLRKARRSKNASRLDVIAAYPRALVTLAPPIELTGARRALESLLARGHTTLPDVFTALGVPVPVAVYKQTLSRVALTLDLMHIGIEPDPRFGALTTDLQAVLFTLPLGAEQTASEIYLAARLLLDAGLSVAAASGDVGQDEQDSLIAGIGRHFTLSQAERARLSARLRLQVVSGGASAARVDARLKNLPETQRQALAKILVEIAAADGHVDPAEIRLLERMYKAMRLEPAKLHADIHHAHRHDASSAPAGTGAPLGALDADTIARKLAETARLHAVLSDIFAEPASLPATTASVAPTTAPAHAPSPWDALPHDIQPLVRSLLARTGVITPDDWESACMVAGLLSSGAMETINEWAFAHADEALLEGEDPIEINDYAREQLSLIAPPPDETEA